MLGYTEQDVEQMKEGIAIAKNYLPLNEANEQTRKDLQDAFDLLDGLIVEGHIESEDDN